MFWCFDPPTRDQTYTHALEGEVLATGLPGKSQSLLLFF